MNAEMTAQLHGKRIGAFTLTRAIRPAAGVVRPLCEGYRVQVYRDRQSKLRLPLLTAALSAERLFDAFLALCEPLGDEVHVVLESSHDASKPRHVDFRRDQIDLPVLQSHFCEHEEMLLNDGCTGVAVLSSAAPMEVQFDEHKILCVYALDPKPFRRVLRDLGVPRKSHLPLISEAEHLHHSSPTWQREFDDLCTQLGVVEYDRVVSDECFES